MSERDQDISFDTFCDIADEFSSCMNDYLFVYDIPHNTYYITERAMERFLLPSNVIHDLLANLEHFVYPEDVPVLADDLQAIISGKKSEHNLEYRWLGHEGRPLWINCRGRLIKDEAGLPSLMVGCINEIGKQPKADNISGLLGESSFREHLKSLDPAVSNISFMRIGIDDFKIINERHGTQYGDYVLSEVAACIHNALFPGQFAYRIVSDEFMVLDLSGADYDSMIRLYHDIRSGVDAVVANQHYKAIYTISAGLLNIKDISLNVQKDYSEAMKLSEFALTEAKNRGKNQLYSFRSEDYTAFLRKRYIRSSLRQALSDDYNGFELYYQPIIMPKGELLYAAEALLRFHTPSGEKISPLEFVPVLEESGLIIPVGKWIIRKSLEMCKKVRKTYPDFLVSINLSYIQLLKTPLFEEIEEALKEAELPPSCLIVELTESGHLEDSPAVQSVWRKLKNIGVNIALDDFGTGYSNLINIGNLRPNIVKIDHSFTTKALKNEYEFELLIHIIRMVHSIGLNLVVEGIETLDDLIRITQLNPDFIQGFYYSMPCPLDVFLKKYDI